MISRNYYSSHCSSKMVVLRGAEDRKLCVVNNKQHIIVHFLNNPEIVPSHPWKRPISQQETRNSVNLSDLTN